MHSSHLDKDPLKGCIKSIESVKSRNSGDVKISKTIKCHVPQVEQ